MTHPLLKSWLDCVMRDNSIDPTSRLVAYEIGRRVGPAGRASGCREELSSILNLSARTIGRCLAELVGAGHLLIVYHGCFPSDLLICSKGKPVGADAASTKRLASIERRAATIAMRELMGA